VGVKEVKMTDFKIQNIVGSHDVGFNIKLEALRNAASSMCTYEPECFPGLIFRMKDPKVVLLIFSSGKIVLTGAKQRQQIYDAYKNIKALLMTHKNEEQRVVQPDYVKRLQS
jgi:transcription initiation factor TFIID TATA-box-binding protein